MNKEDLETLKHVESLKQLKLKYPDLIPEYVEQLNDEINFWERKLNGKD